MTEAGIHLTAYREAQRMELALGDPNVAANSVSFAAALGADEAERLPVEGLAALRSLGWRPHLVPAAVGGRLRHCEELLMLARVLARRDMAVAVSESTQLWALPVWIAGDDAQKSALADAMVAGEVVPSLAYSEESHGADLGANELTAEADGDDAYLLTGRKWPINHGATSTHVVLLARTGRPGNPLGHSLFLVDKAQVEPHRLNALPRAATHGLRGCDISGVAFNGARIPAGALLGPRGRGLELALRGLMLTRTFCTGLSLGVADTQLRITTGYLTRRRLYGGVASDIPQVRETLANAYLSLLIAECASITAMRAMHLYPEQASSWSSLVKIGVTRLVDHSGQALAGILGARSYLRAQEHQGVFQKMQRDGAVVTMFDGSEPVCLNSLATQLPSLARAGTGSADDDWTLLYDLRAVLDDFRPERVQAFHRGRNAVLASLPALRHRLDAMRPDAGCDAERLDHLRTLVHELEKRLGALLDEARELTEGMPRIPGKNTPTRLLALAGLCSSLHAAVTCLGLWLHNRDHLGPFFAGGAWLEAVLARPPGHRFDLGDLTPAATDVLYDQLTFQHAESRYFSILPLAQAAPGSRQQSPA
ncbi:acyl-CoA dehydrogenase family protein [Actinoplanes sp. URMC 104]|uniref:acyl-CoA dehydrogenase family protein n=1 Tax=Actinoplanes sp. URMC 104 TaxID=3423409 RepID=UPI003F1A501E